MQWSRFQKHTISHSLVEWNSASVKYEPDDPAFVTCPVGGVSCALTWTHLSLTDIKMLNKIILAGWCPGWQKHVQTSARGGAPPRTRWSVSHPFGDASFPSRHETRRKSSIWRAAAQNDWQQLIKRRKHSAWNLTLSLLSVLPSQHWSGHFSASLFSQSDPHWRI